MSLLEDLQEAQRRSTKIRTCPLCEFIQSTEDDETREFLTGAAAGTIGRDSLVAVLQRHGTGIGGRTIERHRQEGHTP